MGAEKILVIATVAADESVLRAQLRAAIPEGAEVRVVAPATKVSTLDWLTNAEDDARGEAVAAAERTADALEGEAVTVDRTSHNTDAAQNIADALRLFGPDEIVVVAGGEGDQTWLEEETVREAIAAPGVPVRRVEL
jgi:hypothetical protein